eukprot:g68150.t1
MVLLDGGAKAPVIASWDAFRKMVGRRTAHVTSVYLLCPNGCRGGAMKLNSLNLRSLPRTCTFCRGDIKLDRKTLSQYVLRHFDVQEQLRSILQQPAVRPYVNLDATCIQCLHVPADMKKCPAWREHVQDPSEIVLALYFDGIPAFRGVKYGTYSLLAVSLEILNLPFFLRADPRFTLVSDIVPGPRSPKNLRPVFLPLVEELKNARYEVLFASADYQAQTQLLQHRALSAGTAQNGFHDIPCLVEVQRECISQTPEDALHLVEGCLKRHFFPILAGKQTLQRDGRTAVHSAATWKRWQQTVTSLALSEASQRVLDQRWKRFCANSGRTCTAAPYASQGSMTGEDWYVLSQQGDWIFRGLLSGEFLEYAVTMCTIFRLLAASEPDDRKLMPPPCRPLQFHRLEHGVESRLMGRLVKMLRRRNGIEAHLAAVIRRVQLGRVMCGLLGPAEEALEHFELQSAAARALRRTGTAEAKLKLKLSALATKITARRERRCYRLNLEKFPEADEERAFERYAREATRVPVNMKGKKCSEFVDFVLHGQRFVCSRGLYAHRNQDHSASFVRLKTGEWCRVEKGLELDVEVDNHGVVGIKPVVLNNDPVSHGALRFVKIQNISAPAVTVLKTQGGTASCDVGKRIAMPALAL